VDRLVSAQKTGKGIVKSPHAESLLNSWRGTSKSLPPETGTRDGGVGSTDTDIPDGLLAG